MTAPFEGGCRCGNIRYKSSSEPLFFGHCHCRDCQYASGTGYSSILAVRTSDFEVTRGEYKSFDLEADSGNLVSRKFCPDCGTPLFSELKASPGMWIIKAGSLDDPSWLQPAMHIWCKSTQPWAPTADELPHFDKNPPAG